MLQQKSSSYALHLSRARAANATLRLGVFLQDCANMFQHEGHIRLDWLPTISCFGQPRVLTLCERLFSWLYTKDVACTGGYKISRPFGCICAYCRNRRSRLAKLARAWLGMPRHSIRWIETARIHEEYTHKNRKIQVANLGLYVIALVVFDAIRAK
jgi:hypothetical protein